MHRESFSGRYSRPENRNKVATLRTSYGQAVLNRLPNCPN